jgi:hypothetical protein
MRGIINNSQLLCILLCGKNPCNMAQDFVFPSHCICAEQVRIITTDSEFYSVTRQLNRLTRGGGGTSTSRRRVDVTVVPASPLEGLAGRVAAAAAAVQSKAEEEGLGGGVDMVYVSQVTAGFSKLYSSPSSQAHTCGI